MFDKSFWGFLEELSPFKSKYFFLFSFCCCFVAINIPMNAYSGITLSSRSDLLDVQHRILFDISFIVTFAVNMYLLMVYFLKGVSAKLKRNLINTMGKAVSKREQKKNSSPKEMILFHMIYLISFWFF